MGTIEYGRLIRNAREKKGLTQQQVADAVGIKQGDVSSLERDQRTLDGEHIGPLHELLGVPLGDYLTSVFDIDEVEWAIVRSDLSIAEQDVVLTTYGHLAKRPSLRNAVILRAGEKANPDDK